MSFTKRHYDEVARIIRDARQHAEVARDAAGGKGNTSQYAFGYNCATRDIAENIGRMFASDNPRFDPTRFAMACEPREGGK